jgi:signal peptidase II
MTARALRWIPLPLLVLLADWASKAWVLRNLREHESRTVIQGFFNITLGFNPGAIFGSLQGAPSFWRSALFTLAGVVALAYFGFEFLKRDTPNSQRLALGLILGGILGNGIDRIQHGAVVDFLDFIFFGWSYWTFNLADSAIVCGAILLGIELLRNSRRAAREEAAK